jgi:hypothetical protein
MLNATAASSIFFCAPASSYNGWMAARGEPALKRHRRIGFVLGDVVVFATAQPAR